MLLEGQVKVRGFTMGPGTPYLIELGTNFWRLVTDSRQTARRAWGHGATSGAEFATEKVVPLFVDIDELDTESWLESYQAITGAFRPVGDTGEPVELQFAFGGRTYALFGRPRMADTTTDDIGVGYSHVRCAFVALDPLIYDATEQSSLFGLPSFSGGLTVPFTVPFTVDAAPTDGQVDLTNEGTADTGLILRIDGPVPEPRVTLQRPDGTAETLRFLGDVPSNRFLLIDTAARTALLDGLPQASRRGQISGVWPLLPGEPDGTGATSTLLFRASDNEATGTLTVSHRSAWW